MITDRYSWPMHQLPLCYRRAFLKKLTALQMLLSYSLGYKKEVAFHITHFSKFCLERVPFSSGISFFLQHFLISHQEPYAICLFLVFLSLLMNFFKSFFHRFTLLRIPPVPPSTQPLPALFSISIVKSNLGPSYHEFLMGGNHTNPEKAMATHSSTLAWKIPWTEEPGRLKSMGSLQVRHD